MFCFYRQLRIGAQCNAFQHADIVFTIVHQLPLSSASPSSFLEVPNVFNTAAWLF